jgi:hypothetical protein
MLSNRRVSEMADEQPSRSFGHVLFWRYPRGSWQYDILCLLILAFIFLTPRGVFDGSYFDKAKQESDQVRTVDRNDPSAPSGRVDEKPLARQP